MSISEIRELGFKIPDDIGDENYADTEEEEPEIDGKMSGMQMSLTTLQAAQ